MAEMAGGAPATEVAASDPDGFDGVRMTWNAWPRSKIEASKCVIPVAASISPIRSFADLVVLPYSPLRCKPPCSAVLNPFCRVDFPSRIWICPFCFSRNHFPHHYAAISESNVPGELYPQCSTVEYAIPALVSGGDPSAAPSLPPPIFLFVIDTCVIEEELGFVKSAMRRAIGLIPENALVGLITYGTQVQLHELGFSELSKLYVFRGTKEISKELILDQVGLSAPGSAPTPGFPKGGMSQANGLHPAASINRFLLPASDCEYTLNALLDELQIDQWPVEAGNRARRCTGVALSVAAGLLGTCLPGTGARIVALVGGPCTEGPGMVRASIPSYCFQDLSQPVRSHKDLDKDAAPHFHKAVKFYDNLAKQLVNPGHVLDLFASALDQVGVAEMKVAVERTGGLVVLAESFGHPVFKDSFKRIFESGEQSLGLSFNGTHEINCSKEIKIQGIIGPCTSLEKKGAFCSDTVIGQGNTTAWKICGLDRSTCLTVFFDISPSERSSQSGIPNPQLYIQFLTNYQNSEGQIRLRVTTITRRWVEGSTNTAELVDGFDQETAAVVLARYVSFKMEMEEEFDATRWLDRTLIRLCSRFGDYRKDDPSSFIINPNFSIFPQFMFNLRRSQFVQVFNNSPDETAYFRILLNRESITNSVVMIQPSLISYSFAAPPSPALLDVASIAADRILLLDAYFSVVIFHGTTIAQWRNMGYQNQPEHQAFALLLQAPHDDAQMIIRDRFPAPRLVVCDQHGSQARFLLAKLNPSATYNSAHEVAPGSDIIFTDDASLQVFCEHLQRLAVQS
ncbi:hypothetical protein KFK09_005373 [Dendrobium nobile]|uniref:Protein transport protein SEC23 n=1 Tax=Dendrobium nobile TaxID=94219 RepID=A0A8T3BVJ0_DENNO|nr:hypothetical protein KFK09_005373 [Dendrobium nobile]